MTNKAYYRTKITGAGKQKNTLTCGDERARTQKPALQINLGDFAVYEAFADEYFACGEHALGAGGENYCYVGDDLYINRMNGLVYARLREARNKTALHRNNGDYFYVYARAEARKRLYARKRAQGDGYSAAAHLGEFGLREGRSPAGDGVYRRAVGCH